MSIAVNMHRPAIVGGHDYPDYGRPWATLEVAGEGSITIFFSQSDAPVARAMIARLSAILDLIDPQPEPEPVDEPEDYWLYADAYAE